MRIFESKNFRGFLHRTAGAFFLCALLGLLLVIPSVSSDTDSAKPAESVNIPLYSDWRGESLDDSSDLLLEELLADDDGGVALPAEAFNVGSFSLHRPQSELFINGLIGELYGLSAGAALESDDIEHYLQARARARLTGEAVADFKTWLTGRGEGITDRIFLTSADYLTHYLTAAATDNARGLRFVRTVEWDYQSSLGNRRWQTGLSALGALRESADDAIAWQLRGYAAEDSGAGANAGLIYRRASGAADGALLGVNVFLDYEKHGDYDEDFLRWSLGGEYRNAYLDVYLNRYFPITDGVKQSNGNYVYTQGGQEAYLNVKAPDFGFGRVSGGLTYYLWEGEYGDADDKGFRYHIGFAPQRGNLRLELELDSPDGGSTDWGGRVSYRHTIGAADKGNASASADAAFDARAHFFDVVRREYAQRIRESGDGAPVVVASLSHTSENDAELAFLDTSVDPAAPTTVTVVTLSVAEVEGRRVGDSHAIDPSRTVSITVEMNSTLVLTASNWLVTVFKESAVRLQESGSELSVSSGTISFQRSGSGLNSFNVAGTRISLLGTEGETGIDGNATPSSFMRLMEGTIALTVTTANEIDLDIVELKAVAMVTEEIPDVNGVVNRVERMIGCDTAAQREDHRALQSDFAGCVDDVRISGLGDGEEVMLRTQGEDLILRGNADGEIVVLDGDGNNPSSTTWSSYPFHPHGARLTLLAADATNDGINLSHGEDANESVLEVAAETTLAFSYVDEEAAATTTEAVGIYVAVIGDGTDSGMVSEIGTATETVVDCDANARSTPTTEGLANVIAICGGAVFEDSDGPITEADIVARIGTERSYDVQVSGAGGNYVFAFVDAAGAAVETGSTLSLAAVTAKIATLHFSPDRRIEDRIYYLRAAPLPAFTAYADAATLKITANARFDQLEVVRDEELVATAVTEVEWNKILYRGFEVNGGSNVTYEYIGGACDRSGCNDLTNHFSISSLNGGELRVITTLVPPTSASAEMPGGIPVSLLALPGETPTVSNFPLEVILTVRAVDTPDNTTDDRLKATVTAEFRVLVRNPSGDVTTSPPNYPNQMRDPDDTDFAVVGRTGGEDIATFSGTGNIPITTSSGITISVAGLFSGLGTVPPGTYEYELVNNPPHFVIVSVRPGTSAAVQLDPDNLPSIGAHSVTVRVNDNHSLTKPIDRVVAVSIVTPLARDVADDTGLEVDILVEGADQTITLITVTEGFGDYTYTLESVTPATAAGLFSVVASVQADGTTVGAVSFKDDGAFRDSKQVVAVVLVQDSTMMGALRYHLTVNVLAPYEVVGNVPVQFIATNINEIEAPGNNFHNFPSSSGDGFIIGGTPPYEYALIPESAEDGDDFAIDVASGGLVLDGAATAGGLATVGITVRDSATPDANVTSYLVTVQAINGNIDFDPVDNTPGHVLSFDVAYDAADMNNGVIGTIMAAWEDDTGYGELSRQLVPAPTNPNLLRTVSIDPASGILSLERAVAVATASVFVRVNVAENGYASGDVTVPDEDLLVRLDFHTQVDFVNPQTRIEQQIVSGGGANTALATFAASGGTGDYAFSIEGTPAANVVAIDATSGALSQTGAVNAALTLPLTLRVTDANEDLGGSRDVEIAIEWTAPPPPPEYVGNAGLGRILVIGGSNADDGNVPSVRNNEVWESDDGEDWVQLIPTTGKIFPARHGHAAVSHRGTVYVSGGGNGPLVGGNPPPLLDDVWSSGDGKDWTLVSDGQIPPIAGHNMLARGEDLFIVGGSDAIGAFRYDVWRSGDGGQTWATLDIANNLQSIDAPSDNILSAINAVALFHGGSLVVINGDPAGGKVVALDVTATPLEWEELGATPRAVLGAISFGRKAAFVFNDLIHLSRGEEILSSADGKTWAVARNGGTYGISGGSQVGGHAVLSSVSYIHTESDGSEVRRSRVIITGGQFGTGDQSGRTSRVWGSANGKSNWTNIKTPAEFGNLSYHAMVLVQREGLRLLGPDSSEDAPIENSFPHAAGAELLTLSTIRGTGVETFEIESSTPPSLKDTYLAVGGSDGVVTQEMTLPATETALEGTVIFKVTDESDPVQTDTFKAVVRLHPLTPAGEQRVLLIGGQTGNGDYQVPSDSKLSDGSPNPRAGQFIKAAANDIYASEDGENWVELKRTPGNEGDIFSERAGHAAVALGGTIYISGGRTAIEGFGRFLEITRSDEVWSSTDGAHWTRRSSGAFPARSNHKMLAHNGTLFVIGGLGGTTTDKTILNDVWYSTLPADGEEGLTWTRRFNSLGHGRKNFLAHVHDNGNLLIYGGRSDGQAYFLNNSAAHVNAGFLPADLMAGMQPHGRMDNGRKYDSVSNTQRLNYVAADSAPGTFGSNNVGVYILGRNNVWSFWRGDSRNEITLINTAPAYKCFSDTGTVGHKAARLSSSSSNTLLAIGGLEIERPVAGGIYNDVWSSADDGATWQLLQKFPPFTPRYDQAVVTYTPLESVPALSPVSSPVPLQLKRVCGGIQAVQNDSLANGDELFRVQAGGGKGNYDYSVVSVTPDNAPIDAGALTVVADSADPSIRIVQLIDTPAPVAEVEELFVRVRVSDGAATVTTTVEISLLPQSGLNLEGPFVPVARQGAYSPVARQSDTNGRINNLPPRSGAHSGLFTRTNPNLDDPNDPDDDNDNKDNPPGVLLGTPSGSEGPTEAGVELFRVRTSGGSGEYAKYSYSIIGVEHTPLGGNTILDASYFSVTPIALAGADSDDEETEETEDERLAVGAFAEVEQAKLTDTHATVTVTVEVTDGGEGANNEKSILTVEVELFPSPTLELLVYHAPPSSLPLPPHVLSQRPGDCVGDRDDCTAYQPAIQISGLPRQYYYYGRGGTITVYTPEVGDELFRVGASGIEKSAGGYDFSVVGVLFEKDEATPHSEIGLVELVTVADAEKFIGQDNSKIRIVRLKKELPEELMDENERLIVGVRVSNGDATVNLAMTVHLSSLPRPPAPPAPPPAEVEKAPGILVIGGRQTSNDVNNNAQRINNILFLNLGENVGWSELSAGADFSARSGHAAAVLDGTVYISGGVTGTQLDTEVPLDEVWASSNYGANWIKLDPEPGSADKRFSARYYHKMIEHNGTLFVIGGIKHSINPADEAILNDVWTSTDGANWTQSGVDNVLGHDRNTFLAFVYKGTLMIAGGHSTNRGLRAYNNGAWDDVADIPALPAALYTHDSSLTDRDSSVDAPLAPHDRDPVGAAVAVFNDTIIIYARNHVWSFFDDGDDNTTDVWTRSVTQASYGYLLGFEDLPRRRTGHLAAVRSNAQGEDIAVLLIGGVEHTSTQSTLDDGAGVWASDSGITRRTDIPVAAPGTGVRQGIIGIDFPAAPSSSAAGSDPIGSSMFGRYGHALVVIKPEVVASP